MFQSTIAIESTVVATCTARSHTAARKAAGRHLFATNGEGRWFVQGTEVEGVLTLIQKATERTATLTTREVETDEAVTVTVVEAAPEAPAPFEGYGTTTITLAPAEEAPAAAHRVLSPSRVSRTLGESFNRAKGRGTTGFKVMGADDSVVVYHVGASIETALPAYKSTLAAAGYAVVDGPTAEDGQVYTIEVTLAA